MQIKYWKILLLNRLRNLSRAPQVITKEVGNVGLVILNRPRSLNAIGSKLIVELRNSLEKLENEKSFVILKGAGEKAFTAGGDILEGLEHYKNTGRSYDLSEYILNINEVFYLINTYKIPIVTLMNGITFGGGAGMSVLSKYAIATEKTMFCMPEVKFGFHPNAAASYFFNKHNRGLGYYLGMTAHVLRGTDVVNANYATHFCLSKNLKKLEEELLHCSDPNGIEDIVDTICEKDLPELSLNPIMNNINNCFCEETVEGIFTKLKQDKSEWAKKTLRLLQGFAPTSLKVTLKALHKGRHMNVHECLVMESNLSINFYKNTDALEGTKTVLVDKSYVPKWNPEKLSDVTEDLIEKYFQSSTEVRQRELFSKRCNSL